MGSRKAEGEVAVLAFSRSLLVLHDDAWEDYKLDFDKRYTAEEEAMRYANWKKTTEEFEKYYLGYKMASEPDNATLHVPSNDPIPNDIDWRQQGLVTGVKNQGRCGSCYSFSASGALEGAWAKSHGRLPTLSESQIVDCSGRYGNHGCQGGRYQSSWQYLQSCGGDMSESAYPYTPRQGWCRFNRGQVVATVSGYQNVRGESSLTNAIGSVGPVSVAIDASPRSLRSYRYGVFYDPSCSSYRMNHAVLAV